MSLRLCDPRGDHHLLSDWSREGVAGDDRRRYGIMRSSGVSTKSSQRLTFPFFVLDNWRSRLILTGTLD